MDPDPCKIPHCPRPSHALGLCSTDYSRYRRGKLPNYQPQPKDRPHVFKNRRAAGGLCDFSGCGRRDEARGLCDAHAEQRRRGLPLKPLRVPRVERGCREDGCTRPHEAHGYCSTHYSHAVGRAEIVTSGRRRPTQNREGYVRIWDPTHPNAQKSGYVLEHTAVMTAIIGRPLFGDESVHHLNGVRHDNRPENLELWLVRQRKGQRVADLTAWAKEILARYQPDALA